MSDVMRNDLKAQSVITKRAFQDKKDRLFRALDNDPDLTGPQVKERFGYHPNTFGLHKAEWKELRGVA